MAAEEGLVEVEVEAGVVVDSEMRTGVIAQEATRLAAARRLEGAEAQVMIVGALAEVHHRGGGSVIRALQEAAVVEEGGVVPAIRTPAIGATAGIVAAAATVVDADASRTKTAYLSNVKSHGIRRPLPLFNRQACRRECTITYSGSVLSEAFTGTNARQWLIRDKHQKRSAHAFPRARTYQYLTAIRNVHLQMRLTRVTPTTPSSVANPGPKTC